MDCSCQSADVLEKISQVATIVFAGATFALTIYVFGYQRQQNKLNTRLQWFKELIIEPNKHYIHKFFSDFHNIVVGLHDYQLTDIRKSEIVSELKSCSANFRRDFIVLLGAVDKDLEREVLDRVDLLVDEITGLSFDPNFTLADDAEFDAKIVIPTYNARIYILARIFKYEG